MLIPLFLSAFKAEGSAPLQFLGNLARLFVKYLIKAVPFLPLRWGQHYKAGVIGTGIIMTEHNILCNLVLVSLTVKRYVSGQIAGEGGAKPLVGAVPSYRYKPTCT